MEPKNRVANQDRMLPSLYAEVIPTFKSTNRGAKWNEPSLTITGDSRTGLPWHPNRYGPLEEPKKED